MPDFFEHFVSKCVLKVRFLIGNNKYQHIPSVRLISFSKQFFFWKQFSDFSENIQERSFEPVEHEKPKIIGIGSLLVILGQFLVPKWLVFLAFSYIFPLGFQIGIHISSD